MSATKLQRAVCGKTVVVTGASDGIGAQLAPRLAAAGARVILVARTAEKLKAVGEEIRAAGGEAHEYLADLSNDEDCQRAVAEILADHGFVDVFVSNAGRSVRRSAKYQGGERFHDFERLMSLNFFGALRMILGVLPSMVEQKCGHIVHVSSFGVPTRQPRFAGYCASKSALDGALQSMAGEVASQGVQTSTVYMPLVQTKMVRSKGHSYDHISMLTVDMACELIEHAIITKDFQVMDTPSRFLALLYFFRPSLIVALNSLVYGLESEQAPDGLRRAKSEHEMERRRKRNAQGGFTPLKALGSLLSFFAQLEMFWRRIGVVSIVRDPIIILILLLVLAVELVVATVMAVTSMVRRSVRSIRARLGRKVDLCEVDGSGDHVKEEQPMQPKILRSSSASHEAVVPPADEISHAASPLPGGEVWVLQ
eukprot:CAMPEP_0203930738 /NCGR_PEP_ID=MMETSP0359-20131031/69421_1 /ASSEMBLY_ACC=CAM_ASM_000338 /TAXON_ID=268821 /ORGANISM="Scrippsiella Hangoei, Strain SHTV-5" /LENGTH=423 /DNA_ID=CAMNT_0050859951 /DNA_START=53 /DNA_END=1325 /DNA_ORIENTATION=+